MLRDVSCDITAMWPQFSIVRKMDAVQLPGKEAAQFGWHGCAWTTK